MDEAQEIALDQALRAFRREQPPLPQPTRKHPRYNRAMIELVNCIDKQLDVRDKELGETP